MSINSSSTTPSATAVATVATFEAVSDIQDLNDFLLTTLQEDLFFEQLANFIQKAMEVERIMIYKLACNQSLELVTDTLHLPQERPLLRPLLRPTNELLSPDGTSPLHHLHKGEGVVGQVVLTKRPYYSNNLTRDPLYEEKHYFFSKENASEKILAEKILAELCVPVISNQILFATINLQTNNPHRKFNHCDVEKMLDLLQQISRPLNNLQIYLSAKNLNDALLREIKKQEKELLCKSSPLIKKIDHHAALGNIQLQGDSVAFLSLKEKLATLSTHEENILLVGTKGSGKQTIAKYLYANSTRKERQGIICDCASLKSWVEEMDRIDKEEGKKVSIDINPLESAFLAADGGTLLLTNIEELPLRYQDSPLFNFEKNKQGHNKEHKGHKGHKGQLYHAPEPRTCSSCNNYQVRLISTTNYSLEEINSKCEQGLLPNTLFLKTHPFILKIPSINDRRTDILPLVEYFLNYFSTMDSATNIKKLSTSVSRLLENYNCPNNVAE
ncbi:MAG: sigma 54-interacting transcriptional regulator, partial [Oligoflexia bacterium]|nr:sigma 54-interacting transcriptional regulator [Oligoflexia bacterium]